MLRVLGSLPTQCAKAAVHLTAIHHNRDFYLVFKRNYFGGTSSKIEIEWKSEVELWETEEANVRSCQESAEENKDMLRFSLSS